MLVYDWCHDQFTSAQLSTMVRDWNVPLNTLAAKPYAATSAENNYFWGYF